MTYEMKPEHTKYQNNPQNIYMQSGEVENKAHFLTQCCATFSNERLSTKIDDILEKKKYYKC